MYGIKQIHRPNKMNIPQCPLSSTSHGRGIYLGNNTGIQRVKKSVQIEVAWLFVGGRKCGLVEETRAIRSSNLTTLSSLPFSLKPTGDVGLNETDTLTLQSILEK